MRATSGRSTKNRWRRQRSSRGASQARVPSFEFAHLLDPFGQTDGHLLVADLGRRAVDLRVPQPDPMHEELDLLQQFGHHSAEPEPMGEVDALLGGPGVNRHEPDAVIEPAAAVATLVATLVATSRFAAAGLDDDRLPLARRR